MRMLKVPLVALTILFIVGGTVSAQIPPTLECINQYIDCATDVSESSVDEIRLPSFQGKPGDTVWLPVYLETDTDTVSGFSIIIQYDDTYLSPVKVSDHPLDSFYVKYELLGGLLEAQHRYAQDHPLDSTIFSAQVSQNPFDYGAITCGFNLATFNRPERLNPAAEVIFRLAFAVDQAMPEFATANFELYQVNEYQITDTAQQEALCIDCRRSNLSVDRTVYRDVCVDSIPSQIDSSAIPWDTLWECTQIVEDSQMTVNATLNPTTTDGIFTANPSPPPLIAAFFTPDDDDSVGTNSGFILQWSVDNTDSIVIYQGANRLYTSVETNSFYSATSPATEGTYPYTLWAYNEFSEVSSSFDLLVQDGGGTQDPHAPTLVMSSVYSIDVGSTLNFTVSSSDIDGDPITLSAVSLPSGASFPTAQGTGSTSSSFSWTPGLSQSGNHVATFRAEDNTGLFTQQPVTIIVNEPQFDKLFTSSVPGSSVGGLPGKTAIEFPINLVTSQTVYGVQFDFVYDADMFEVTGVDVTINTAEYVVYENIGQTPGEVRFVAFGMANEPIGSEGTEILLVELAIEPDAAPGLYTVFLEDAWESVNPDPNFPALPLVSDTGIIQVDTFGDINLDTNVNVADLVSIVGYIIGDFTLDSRRYEIADVVVDGSVDVFDLVAIVNLIYGAPISPSPGQYIEDRYAVVELDYHDMPAGASQTMLVRSEMPVDIAGVQLEILYDPAVVELGTPSMTEEVAHLAMRSRDDDDGRLTILMYFTNPFAADQMISAGRSDLLEIPVRAHGVLRSDDKSQLILNKALLSTSNAVGVKVEGLDRVMLPNNFFLAQNYPNPFNPTTTISFTLGAPGSSGAFDAQLDIFNILGQNVNTLLDETLPAGNHQVLWDGSDHKGNRVASGIYLYKLQVGSESQTKKMLLLK